MSFICLLVFLNILSRYPALTQMIKEEQEILILKTVVDKVNDILDKLNGQEKRLSSLEENQRTLSEMINETKTEWRQMNNDTRTDVATLQRLLDTDECDANSTICPPNTVCVDTRVSFRCECPSGFVGDGNDCNDIDECAGANSCDPQATCTNVLGSYTCQCLDGFRKYGETCEDVDECIEGNHRCHEFAVCHNTVGNYTCECTFGNKGDGFNCTGCPSDFKMVSGVGCIRIIDSTQPWEKGRSMCKDAGGDFFVAKDPDHYLRLTRHLIDIGQKSNERYLYVGVKGGVWLSGRKVDPSEEAHGNPSMTSGKCSYTDGDTSEKFLLWTDPCGNHRGAVCALKDY